MASGAYYWGMPPQQQWPPANMMPPPPQLHVQPAPPPQSSVQPAVYPPSPAASPLSSPFIPPAFIDSPVMPTIEVGVQPGGIQPGGVQPGGVQPSGVIPPSPAQSPGAPPPPMLWPGAPSGVGAPLLISSYGMGAPFLTPIGTPFGSPYTLTPPGGSPWAAPSAAPPFATPYHPPGGASLAAAAATPYVPPLATPLFIPSAVAPPSPPPSGPDDVQIAPWLAAGTLRWECARAPSDAKYCSPKGVFLPLASKLGEDATWPLPERGATVRIGDTLLAELWGPAPLPDDDEGATTGGVLAAVHAFLQKSVRPDEVPRIKDEDGRWDAAVRAMADRCRNSPGLPEAEWARGMRRVDVLGGKTCVGFVTEGDNDGWGLVLVLEG